MTSTGTDRTARNIVLLLDGTGNEFSEQYSNLIKTMSVIKADETQLVYYSSGLGTVLPESTSTWGHLRQKTAEMIDMGLAWNFDEFVCDAYKYLMDFYKTGDKIYLFGFSRGAYTVRALAGMIQRVGLLPPGNYNQIPLAYEQYTSKEVHKDNKDPSVVYRRIFGRSRPVAIEFMGVWDTVSSIGGFDLPISAHPSVLPFAGGAKSIKFFRHALALDERRAKFTPEYWRPDAPEVKLKADIAAAVKAGDKAKVAELEKRTKEVATMIGHGAGSSGERKSWEKIVECWFMGCHSDVGGGNTDNDTPALSNIPFRWMLREAVRCGLLLDPVGVAYQSALQLPHNHTAGTDAPAAAAGIEVDDQTTHNLSKLRDYLATQIDDPTKEIEQEAAIEVLRKALPQAELAKVVEIAAAADTAHGAEADELGSDARANINESLTGKWQALELFKMKTRNYTAEGVKEDDEWKRNNGDGRQIVPGQRCHRSVLRRLLVEGSRPKDQRGYKGPSVHVAQGWPEWDEVRKGKADEHAIWLD